jgi:uncharacterized membrane protein YcjF (UPF0283 family)
MKSNTSPRAEGKARRTIEWILLTLSLLVGLSVVGACGGIGFATYSRNDALLNLLALLGAAIVLIGLVYLATSMSRDVRLLKQALLEKDEKLSGGHHPESRLKVDPTATSSTR